MPPPLSQLVYRRTEPATSPPRATVIALHGDQGGLDDLGPLTRSLGSDLRVVAPEAARGVYLGMDLVSRTWYGGALARPEPASFGDSLAQIERFVHDELARRDPGDGRLPVLLGCDQGAVLALALAAIAPDLLSGVMAIGGCLPTFSDPTLLAGVASSLPVLLIADPDADPPRPAVEETVARLSDLGARVTVNWIPSARSLGPPVVGALRAWFEDRTIR